MRILPPRLPCAPSIFTPSPAMRATRPSTKRAPPSVFTSHATPPRITATRIASKASTRTSQRRRARVCGGGGDSRTGASAFMSEGDGNRECEADLVQVLRVSQVDREGTRRRAEPRAHAVARIGLHVLGAVLGVAHVDEGGRAPALVEPVYVFERAGREVAP